MTTARSSPSIRCVIGPTPPASSAISKNNKRIFPSRLGSHNASRRASLTFVPLSIRRQQSGVRYPVVVRFEKVNYAGVSTNNYALDEIEY